MSITGTKDQREARADLKKDGRPVLYVYPPPPVDNITGEPGAGGLADVQTYCIVESAETKTRGTAAAAKSGSISDSSNAITVPAIDFLPHPPVNGGTFYLGPSGQKTFPVVGAPGVRALRMTSLYDTAAEGVDEILYIVLVTGEGPARP